MTTTTPVPSPRHAQQNFHVTRTVQTLECLAEGPITAIELAEALQIPTRTARRILYRLAFEGWVTRGPGVRGKFAATPRLRQLAGRLAG
jgi:DNA-binding IclR family transcriptional regulator